MDWEEKKGEHMFSDNPQNSEVSVLAFFVKKKKDDDDDDDHDQGS